MIKTNLTRKYLTFSNRMKTAKYNPINKMIEDKKAIMDCIRNNGDLKQLLKERRLKLATPI